MLVKSCLSTVKVSQHRFTQRRSLVKLVQACLGKVKVCKRSEVKDTKHRFSHRGCLLMLVKAWKFVNVVFTTVEVSDYLAGLFKYREGLQTYFSPL